MFADKWVNDALFLKRPRFPTRRLKEKMGADTLPAELEGW